MEEAKRNCRGEKCAVGNIQYSAHAGQRTK